LRPTEPPCGNSSHFGASAGTAAMLTATTSCAPSAAQRFSVAVSARTWLTSSKPQSRASRRPDASGQNMKASSRSVE
jgi:hypothetical protein